MTSNIRPATIKDAREMKDIYNDALREPFTTWRRDAADQDEVAGWLPDRPNGKIALIVHEDIDGVTGFAALGRYKPNQGYEKTADISVYVRTDKHRQGIGRRLLEALLSVDHGVTNAVASIDAGNENSLKLHEKLGFKRVGLLPGIGFKAGHARDLVIMQKAL